MSFECRMQAFVGALAHAQLQLLGKVMTKIATPTSKTAADLEVVVLVGKKRTSHNWFGCILLTTNAWKWEDDMDTGYTLRIQHFWN